MAKAPIRRYALPLCFAAVSVLHAFVPSQVEAATGLFAVERTFYNDQVGRPNQTKSAFFQTQSGSVGTIGPQAFTVPQSAIKDTTGEAGCILPCRLGYPIDRAWYSYWNLRGSFRPNNPHGATMTTTVRFPTTMGMTGPPLGTGDPITPTTTFSGRYDFKRAGSIMITPGPNRFGGTMQFFYGPNHRYYQRITIDSAYCCERAYGGGQPSISIYHESQVGEFILGRRMDRYRMTTAGYQRMIVGTTPSGGPEYYHMSAQYISTIVPFTTGRVTGYQPFGATTTVHTLTGYDNRTPAGLSGVISLVRPRLVHTYVVPHVYPDESIWVLWAPLSTWRINFRFLPEPGGGAMLIAGVVALAGLRRVRRQ